MVSVRKRPLSQEDVASPSLPPTLVRLRNMWQFACLWQWFYIFGGVVKADTLDIDDLEVQSLNPQSMVLQNMGLSLLKFLSSHRGLTHELFDEYTRRQYVAKAPEMENPFGTGEIPAKFSDFDVFKKIRVLHQMTQFVMMYPEKLREKMAEQKDADHDQTSWRIEPFGWDSKDHSYYILDDNRIYRLIDPPPAAEVPVRPKKNTKKARAEARRKRRRISSAATTGSNDEGAEAGDESSIVDAGASGAAEDNDAEDGLGGMKWNCVAVSLEEVRQFLATIPGKKDANEKILREKIACHLVPILEQQEERRQRKERERQKELLNLAKMATAKRSSRIASRQELHRQEELMREEEQKRRREQEEQRKEEQKRRKMERERDNRLMSREKRLRERDLRRAQYEEELAQLSEDSRDVSSAGGRMSERRREAEMEKSREALRELEQEEEEEWSFDCVCGLHGQVDDGQHSVSCEKCNIWQHSRCLGINEEEAEKDDFHFVCDSCRRRALEERNAANQASARLPVIKIKVNRPLAPAPAAAATPVPTSAAAAAGGNSAAGPSPLGPQPFVIDIPAKPIPIHHGSVKGGSDVQAVVAQSVSQPAVQPTLQAALQPALQPPPEQFHKEIPVKLEVAPAPVTHPSPGAPGPMPQADSDPAFRPTPNGTSHNAFSSPHPALSAPGQSPRKSHAYETIYDQSSPAPANITAALPKTGGSPSSPALSPYPLNGTGARATGPNSSPTTAQGYGPKLAVQTPLAARATTQQQRTPSSITTPRLQHPRDADGRIGLGQDQASSPLVPSQGGLSPTKHSPVVASGNGIPSSSPAAPIFPPVAALSPSPPEQNLAPPVKAGGLAHPQQPLPPQPSEALSPSTDGR